MRDTVVHGGKEDERVLADTKIKDPKGPVWHTKTLVGVSEEDLGRYSNLTQQSLDHISLVRGIILQSQPTFCSIVCLVALPLGHSMDAAPTLRNGEAKGGANVKKGYYRAVKLSLFGLSYIS